MSAVNLKTKGKKKLLVLDLDGTVLTEDKIITERTRDYLDRAWRQGTELCFATGRNYISCKDIPLKYQLRAYLICANGAMIKDPYTSKEYYRATVPHGDGKSISQYASKINALIHIFTEEDWFINKVEESALNFGKRHGITPKLIQDIKNWNDLDIIKMVVVDTPDKINNLEAWALKERFDIHIVRSDPYSIDITNKNASKGNGVKKMSKILGIEKEDIIAVGNYYNDIDMFKVAKIGIAMDNSPDEVKMKADFVTKSNEQDGIVCVIEEFIL